MTAQKTRYNKDYFDRWYRYPGQRVSTIKRTQQKAALVVGVAEYYLERRITSVLDVGCGEGQWQPVLKKLRPKCQYIGVDCSEYAIKRFGKERNLVLGDFNNLPPGILSASYDVIICSDILYYIPLKDLQQGLSKLIPRLKGIAFLEAYSSDESLIGDTRRMLKRSAGDYQRLFKKLGLLSCGSHCYAAPI